MKRYAKMTTEKLWYTRAMCTVRIEDVLHRAIKDNTLVNMKLVNRIKQERGAVDIELEKRGLL